MLTCTWFTPAGTRGRLFHSNTTSPSWNHNNENHEKKKTIELRQDPPFCKKAGGLFMYHPPPTLKDGVLFV